MVIYVRVFMKQRISVKVIRLKKLILIIIITAMLGVLVSGFFTRIYKPFITSAAIGKTNNVVHKISNDTVLEIIKNFEYKSFVNVMKNETGSISGIETDTIKINKFKSEFLSELSKKMQNLSSEKFAIPILSFFNNPFLSEIGPSIHIRLKPIGVINADVENIFISTGVNQTKHQIDLKYKINILIVMPGIQTEHIVSSTIPVAQTVIVGEVPQSYTNVTTSDDNMFDTVLQLAEN